MTTRRQREHIRNKIEACSAGDIVAAANIVHVLRNNPKVTAEAIVRRVLIAALIDDQWLDRITPNQPNT
jgi:hypothetical protein